MSILPNMQIILDSFGWAVFALHLARRPRGRLCLDIARRDRGAFSRPALYIRLWRALRHVSELYRGPSPIITALILG